MADPVAQFPVEEIPDEDHVYVRYHKGRLHEGKLRSGVISQVGEDGISCDWSRYQTASGCLSYVAHNGRDPSNYGLVTVQARAGRLRARYLVEPPRPARGATSGGRGGERRRPRPARASRSGTVGAPGLAVRAGWAGWSGASSRPARARTHRCRPTMGASALALVQVRRLRCPHHHRALCPSRLSGQLLAGFGNAPVTSDQSSPRPRCWCRVGGVRLDVGWFLAQPRVRPRRAPSIPDRRRPPRDVRCPGPRPSRAELA